MYGLIQKIQNKIGNIRSYIMVSLLFMPSMGQTEGVYSALNFAVMDGTNELYDGTWLPPSPDASNLVLQRIDGLIQYDNVIKFGGEVVFSAMESLRGRFSYGKDITEGYNRYSMALSWKNYGVTLVNSTLTGIIEVSKTSLEDESFNDGMFESNSQFFALYTKTKYGKKRGIAYAVYTKPELLLLYDSNSRVSNLEALESDQVLQPSALYFDQQASFQMLGYYLRMDGPFDHVIEDFDVWAPGEFWYKHLLNDNAYLTISLEGESVVGIAAIDVSDDAKQHVKDKYNRALKIDPQYALGVISYLRMPVTVVQRYRKSRVGASLGLSLQLYSFYKGTTFRSELDEIGLTVRNPNETLAAYGGDKFVANYLYGFYLKLFAAW